MQPPASLEALGDPIYEAFYGLKEQPFAITTDPRFFYLSVSHQRAFSELLNGLKRHESIMLVTGETGTGKTTLCRAVLESLGARTFSALILNPYMSGAEVLRIVLRDFGFVSHEDLRRGALAAADVPQLLDALEGFLKSLQPLASHAVIVIDEAQALSPTILDQIRLLTALEHDHRRLVQVVLCGQPGLLNTIKTEAMNALNERITRRVELAPLQGEDVDRYIQHRLAVAGAGEAVKFDRAATVAVADLSRGLPRRINVICDRALQEGRIEGVSVISTDLVKRAARALAGAHDPMPVIPVAPAAPVLAPAPAPAAVDRVGSALPGVNGSRTAPATDAEEKSLSDVAVAAPAPLPTLAETVELTFGQQEEAPANPARKAMMGAAAAAAIIAGGYFAWAWTAGTPTSVVPTAPKIQVLSGGAPAVAVPVPSAEEMDAMFAGMVYRRPAPVDDEPAADGQAFPPLN